jgi:hypothetical protein
MAYNPVLIEASSELNEVEIIGVQDGGAYTQDLIITISEGTATIDGQAYISGTTYNIVGYHTLVVYDDLNQEVESIDFTILPRFTDSVDGAEYLDTYTLNLENEADVVVNYKTADNGTNYTTLGTYNVHVYGTNGFHGIYHFDILSSTLEYLDTHVTFHNIDIDIDQFYAVYINKIKQHEDFTFSKVGNYSIEVLGLNNFKKTYTFTKAYYTTTVEVSGVYDRGVLLQKQDSVSWKIDGVNMADDVVGRYITKVGEHTVTFYGENDYEKSISFTITEGDIGLYDGKVYNDYFSLDFEGFSVTVNGVAYKTGLERSGAGYYDVVIKGANGYVSEYNVLVKEDIPFEDFEVLNESLTLDMDFETIYVNGKEVENYRFYETGKYRVVLEGINGYIEGYTVYYTNGHDQTSSLVLVTGASLGVLLVITYGFVGWRRFR